MNLKVYSQPTLKTLVIFNIDNIATPISCVKIESIVDFIDVFYGTVSEDILDMVDRLFMQYGNSIDLVCAESLYPVSTKGYSFVTVLN